MSDKKRKRRSFWEPESEKIVSWLNDQSDLGTSLQLIIVDAIHNYGEGDVIKAHLNQRESFGYENEPQTPARKPVRNSAPSLSKDTSEEEPEEQALPQVSEPEGRQVSGGGPEQESEQELDIEAELESDVESENEAVGDEEVAFDTADLMSGAEDEEQGKGEEPEYDPIAIMMQDSGSTFNK